MGEKEEWGVGNDSKHICPQFVCSYNTKPQARPCTNQSQMYNGRLRKCFQTLGFNTRTHGNSLSPRNESRDRLGNTDIDSGGIHKQVARVCEWMQKGFWWGQVDSRKPSV